MRRYLLHNHHDARECGATYAAFKGHASPLRHRETASSCLTGGHEIWWLVEADSAGVALGLLPHYVAQRSTVTAVRRVRIP